MSDFTFFFGAASGSARKALRRLEEPNVMINYATELNQPWNDISNLFIDSGGYSFMLGKGEYETTDAAYLEYITEHNPEIFALRDYPCEPEVLKQHNRTVADHQQMTIDRHRNLLNLYDDRNLNSKPYSVLQGWGVDDYIDHINQMIDAGTLTDAVGIGSVCGREKKDEIQEIITTVAETLPNSVRNLHAFGIKETVLEYPSVREALTSADSQAYDLRARWTTLTDIDIGARWKDNAFEYLRQKRQINRLLAGRDDSDTEQMTLSIQT